MSKDVKFTVKLYADGTEVLTTVTTDVKTTGFFANRGTI